MIYNQYLGDDVQLFSSAHARCIKTLKPSDVYVATFFGKTLILNVIAYNMSHVTMYMSVQEPGAFGDTTNPTTMTSDSSVLCWTSTTDSSSGMNRVRPSTYMSAI